jgi:hypothetical protein
MTDRVDWWFRGLELSTCNCNWGCPCHFSGVPSLGNCRAAAALQIDTGQFGDTRLDGLRFCLLCAWPGPIHEGKGEMQLLIDERANAAQRRAILAIGTGENTEPAATFFSVYRLMSDTLFEPKYVPIEFTVDLEAGSGSFSVPGLIETTAEPIRHPKTGKLNRVRLFRPFGVEFRDAEFVSGSARTTGARIPLQWSGRHAHLAQVHMTPRGPLRD